MSFRFAILKSPSLSRGFGISCPRRAARKVVSKEPDVSPPATKRRGRPVMNLLPSDPTKSKLDLPLAADWRQHFSYTSVITRDRVSISNIGTARSLAKAFVGPGSAKKVVIEAFPGPGALTRALLELPAGRIKRLIVLEDQEQYLEYLRPLAERDPRVKIIPVRGFSWDGYQTIDDLGLLSDVEKVPWEDGLHPQLQFISHLPLHIMSEQFVAQLLRCIPEHSWLFQYGRVPMNLILNEWIWHRLSANVDQINLRCKLSVIAEAASEFRPSVNPSWLLPYESHFHPVLAGKGSTGKPSVRKVGSPFIAINILPKKEQFIAKGQIDKWDFCLRRLFVLRSTPLKSAIGHLAPGADSLCPSIIKDGVDINKQVRKMTVEDWASVVKAFSEWPFAPEDLLISDSFSTTDRDI